MYYSVLRLPNGTELKGGEAGSTLKALTLHTAVNSGQEFTIGSAFSDYLEAEIWADPDGSLQITAGDALTYYRQDDAGNRTKVGVFYAEKPTRTKRNSYKVTAYDTMSKLDADFSGWLHANQAQFPKTIWQLVQLACQRAGVTLASSSLPINGSYSVQAFYADDLTCRQIISWAAEASGCYAHMNADGKLQFLTYSDKRSTAKITPDGASNSTAYYADSLSYEDYTVKAIEKVQIRQSDSDVGVIYPDSTTATNTYAVQGNLLLTTGTEANLKSVAQNLYNVLKNVTYTPCKVSVPSSSGLACGQIVHVKDARGREFDTYLMSATISSGKASFESVGSASRESSSAVNSQSYKNLTGKMLEIKTSVDGLEVKASDLTGKYTDLKATVDGLSSEVKKDTKITGGGNLILGSESFKNAALQGGGTVEYNDDGSATVTNSNSLKIFDFNTTSTRIVKGVTLCISVMYKQVSGKDAFYLDIHYSHANGSRYYTSIKPADQIKIEQSDGWVLRYGTWTPKDNYILTGVRFGLQSGSVTNKYMALHPMLQYGNAPTAWNASSGDYLTQESAKSLFSQTADEIKTEVTKSVTESVTETVKDTATSAANDAVDSKLQDYATTATVNSLKEDVSSISQKADSISTKVSSLKETTTTISNDLDSTKQEFKTVKESVSAIDQKADSITQTVTQRITGGNNLILGSESFKNAELKGNAVSGSSVTYNDTGSATVTNANSNRYFHWKTVNEHASAGVTLCLSVMYKPVSGTDELCMEINYNNTWAVIKAADQIEIKQTNGWVLRYGLWTPPSDATVKWVDIGSGSTHAGIGNYTNKFELLHPMLQYGNAPTAWTASTGDYLTANETKTEIKQTVSEIKLTASTSGTSSTIKLTAGGTEITSAQINLSGVVTFSDLSTWNQDKTIINGGNITTGQIHNKARTTTYDLDNAWIRMGKDAGTRVDIDTGRIRWYWENNLTGVLSSRYGKSYIGDNSRYTFLGWFSTGDPSFDYSTGGATSEFVGIAIDQVDKVIHCNASKFEIPGRIECSSLSVNGREI